MTKTVTPKRVTVGLEFYAGYADSNSKWIVRKSLGGAWLCEIINDPIEINGKTYPGEYNGTKKSFMSAEILGSLGMSALFSNLADDNEKFLQSQKPGTILHYHNGFGNYVRQIVVLHEGRMKLKAIALVGEWAKHDLPMRRANGDISSPYHVKKIQDGELSDRLQCSTTYEHPTFSKPRGGKESIDPRKLNPINLELPPLEGDIKVATELWQLIERVQAKLNPETEERQKEGNQFDPATPMKRLRAAYELLEPLLNGERED